MTFKIKNRNKKQKKGGDESRPQPRKYSTFSEILYELMKEHPQYVQSINVNPFIARPEISDEEMEGLTATLNDI